jgi:acyl carrier protein
MGDVTQAIRAFLADKVVDQQIGENDELLEGGILDSVGVLGLVTQIEESFGVHIEPADLNEDNFHNIKAISQMVNRLRSQEGAA